MFKVHIRLMTHDYHLTVLLISTTTKPLVWRMLSQARFWEGIKSCQVLDSLGFRKHFQIQKDFGSQWHMIELDQNDLDMPSFVFMIISY